MGTSCLTLSSYTQKLGGARRDRTADLYTASVALSQLSYSPDEEASIFQEWGAVVKRLSQKNARFFLLFIFNVLQRFLESFYDPLLADEMGGHINGWGLTAAGDGDA